MKAEPWNHNIHYHPLILGAVPDGARDGLDVGCGEGMLARTLCRVMPRLVAIDLDQASIDMARTHGDGAGVDYLVGDFLTYPFEPESFDLIASVAALHHMDTTMALGRMRDLLRPGGTLAVVGLARGTFPADLPMGSSVSSRVASTGSPSATGSIPRRRCGHRRRPMRRFGVSPPKSWAASVTFSGATRWFGPSRSAEQLIRGTSAPPTPGARVADT